MHLVGMMTVALAASRFASPSDPMLQHADTPSLQLGSAPSLEVALLAGAWFPRLDGETSLGGGEIKFADQLDLDSGEAIPRAELSIRRGDTWELTLSGFEFETDSTTDFIGAERFGSLVLISGEPVRSNLELTSVAAELRPWLWRPIAGAAAGTPRPGAVTRDGRAAADFRFAPIIAARYIGIEQRIERLEPGLAEEADGAWFGVLAGLATEFRWRPEQAGLPLDFLQLDAGVAIGPAIGGDGGVFVQVGGGLTAQVSRHVGAQLGWRLTGLSAENDEYDISATIQGLFLAVSIRF